MQPNPGKCPREAAGKRVRGVLRCGKRFGFESVNSTAPAGWAADTTRWTLTGHSHDVVEYEVI